jgi:alkanesulfonate monooxygenase SsuD/methylene tetrahydromethanopterin reductase-like flavin-dependent oxidoreductase (luciferase family)
MLSITLPFVDSWNSWFADTANSPDGVPALRERVDAACRDVGRNPADVERTVAVLVELPGGSGRIQGGYSKEAPEPLTGSSAEMAEVLRGYAREGIGHVQLVLDPITVEAIRALEPVLAELDRR